MANSTSQKGVPDASARRRKSQIIIFAVLIAIFLLLHVATGFKLLSATNIQNIIVQAVFPAFVAWGMMFIFGTGLVDLSIGANIILSTNIGIIFAEHLGMGYIGLIIATTICVVILEQITVNCSITLQIPSWVSGLGMALFYEAVLSVLLSSLPFLKGTNILQLTNYRVMGTMPTMAILWLLGFLVVSVVYNQTTLSYNLQAVGGNPGVAAAMGINRKKTIMLGAVVGSLFIAAGAILNVSYVGRVAAVSGLASMSTIFKSLATLLLAGSFSRYLNQPLGVFLGAIIIASVFNSLTLLGVPSGTWQEIFLGIIVISCGIVSNFNNKRVVK